MKHLIPKEFVYFVRKRILRQNYSDLIYYDKKRTDIYDEDCLFSYAKNLEFLQNPAFRKAYDSAVKDNLHISDSIQWRVHTLCWAASVALHLEGDFVECGVNKGFCSRIIIDYLDFKKSGKKFYLLDTYTGLVESLITEEEAKSGFKNKSYEPCLDLVRKVFSKMDFVKIVDGIVPDTLARVDSDKIAFLHIDMNSSVPESEALKFFWPKLTKGAMVIFDDYGWSTYSESKKKHDAFATSQGVQIFTLPTGQGMLVKN
jgi:hypothetical protein